MSTKIEDIELRLLLEAIFHKYGYDFRNYSMASLKRRLLQACEEFKCRSFSQLQDYILHDMESAHAILAFMTVQVSEMFRDPSYFKAFREQVVPVLRTYPSIKLWIAGCSAGEEFYSFAIILKEENLLDKTVFYCTDINHQALNKAKTGIYSLDRMKKFSMNYRAAGGTSSLSDYYTTSYDAAIFDKSLRKNVVFSDHSLVSDASFGEMHFISCRNVLIYFDKTLQDRVLGLFKDSLIRSGYLGLGAKENMLFSIHRNAFEEVIKNERIFHKISV
ncbi:MAG: CheR family methyltransferase [Pseudomonadota bacterium]|nr:chemotaxis protein CheR [Gammaproteobacteria bacterium]MEC8010430.1 CheR family methyltransferase [Pseudomonadota bacterium]HBF09071.1 chemotaxis protein CheR [Gammaproteobacteria bacterium]|tara:strand:+ start:35 stop:859 length:825 start_codon:yes stop_codon:yes gene_type:complete